MASEYDRVGLVELACGRALEIGRNGSEVLVWSPRDDTLLRFGKAAREDFQRLFMEAERRAEAHAAPAVSETDTP